MSEEGTGLISNSNNRCTAAPWDIIAQFCNVRTIAILERVHSAISRQISVAKTGYGVLQAMWFTLCNKLIWGPEWTSRAMTRAESKKNWRIAYKEQLEADAKLRFISKTPTKTIAQLRKSCNPNIAAFAQEAQAEPQPHLSKSEAERLEGIEYKTSSREYYKTNAGHGKGKDRGKDHRPRDAGACRGAFYDQD